jgi:hypothetical protein
VDQIFNRIRAEKPLAILVLATITAVCCHEWKRQTHYIPKTKKLEVKQAPIPIPEFFKKWRKTYIDSNHDFDSLGLVRGIFLGDDSAVLPETRLLFRRALPSRRSLSSACRQRLQLLDCSFYLWPSRKGPSLELR